MKVFNKSIPYMFLAAASILCACGDKDSNDVTNPTSKTIELTFEDGEAGSQYFIMPYTLGALTGDTAVQGGTDASIATFAIKTSGATLTQANPTVNLNMHKNSDQLIMTGREYDHALRGIINRFNPQDANTWAAIKDLDGAVVLDGPYATQNYLTSNSTPPRKSLIQSFQAFEANLNTRTKTQSFLSAQNLAESSCLKQSEILTIGTSDELMDATMVPLKSDSAEYCLYVHSTKGMVTETNLETLKKSIETALSLYKTVIYNDTMTKTKDSYKFIPHFFILPYGDDTYWKDNAAGSFKITGAFSASHTIENARPSLYIAADQGAVSSETDSKKLYETFHATIAHELQHAILHYYRYTAGLAVDAPQFDEGLAHLMEDVLGYGEASFPDFATSFLATFNAGLEPVLSNITQGAGTASQRGAAQVLFYYLSSQKGGITFNGKVSGGEGLSYIRSFLSGSKTNIEGLVAAYGDDWVTTMGNLFGAISIDNATTVTDEDIYKAQAPIAKTVTDTKGTGQKTFGFRFNNYGTLLDVPAKMDIYSTAVDTPELELQNYMTKPLLVTLGSEDDTVTITMGQLYENSGVKVIKIK